MGDSLIGRQIRDARHAAALTQARLAALMTDAGYQMHQTGIAKLEHGERDLSLDEAVALAAILGPGFSDLASYLIDDARHGHELRMACARLAAAERNVAAAEAMLAAAHAQLHEIRRQVAKLEHA